MTTTRPTDDEWTPHGDWRNQLATLVSGLVYCVPWFVLQAQWPLYLPASGQRLPPVALTLGLGVGWFVVMVPLFALLVPWVLERSGKAELAWRWRGGAIHATSFALVVNSASTGMRLPFSTGLQVLVSVALVALGALELAAVHGLARRGPRSTPTR